MSSVPLDIVLSFSVGFVCLLGFAFLFLYHARAGHYICGLFRDEIFFTEVFSKHMQAVLHSWAR